MKSKNAFSTKATREYWLGGVSSGTALRLFHFLTEVHSDVVTLLPLPGEDFSIVGSPNWGLFKVPTFPTTSLWISSKNCHLKLTSGSGYKFISCCQPTSLHCCQVMFYWPSTILANFLATVQQCTVCRCVQ